MIRRTPIRKVSKKRVKVNREYMKLRAEYLKLHPYCEWYMAEHGINERDALEHQGWYLNGRIPMAQDIHHKRGRGKYLLDPSHFMAVSRLGHESIHHNVADSYAKGYMLPRNDYEQVPNPAAH